MLGQKVNTNKRTGKSHVLSHITITHIIARYMHGSKTYWKKTKHIHSRSYLKMVRVAKKKTSTSHDLSSLQCHSVLLPPLTSNCTLLHTATDSRQFTIYNAKCLPQKRNSANITCPKILIKLAIVDSNNITNASI